MHGLLSGRLGSHQVARMTGPSSEPDVVRLKVAPEDSGLRLDQMLASRLADRTRSHIQRLIKGGHARVGPKPGRASTVVRSGDVVTLHIPPPRPAEPKPEALHVEIVYDDPDIVVVDKPAGMVIHPAAGHSHGTLVNALLAQIKDLSGIGGTLRPGIVHRLDRGTSGILVVAKHDQGSCRARPPIQEPGGREELYHAGVGRRPGRSADRPANRARPDAPQEDFGLLAPAARGGHPSHQG